MMEEADDSWIELVRKEIFNLEGSVGPFHILIYGITAEVGAYAQLWGFFYYKLSWEEGSDEESICAGALHTEIGIYLEIKFKAQFFGSEKLTYNLTLYENQWPIYTIGEQEYVYAFNWSPGEEDDTEAEGPTYEYQSVRRFSLPTGLFDMAYMDMQSGDLSGVDADDEEENPSAKLLLRLVDMEDHLRGTATLHSFTCGYRLACGIHKELAEEPLYSFAKEEEERACRKAQPQDENDSGDAMPNQ